MKKIILLASIALTMLGTSAKAQVIQAQGKRVVLTQADRQYLLALNLKPVTSVLSMGKDLKYNDTADMILTLLQARKSFTQLIARK